MTPHFANPAGAWLLLAMVPILALYLLRHRRPPRKIPSLRLYRLAERDRQAERTLRTLVPELSLLLQLSLVALAALTAMRPRWSHRHDADAALAIVLDLSASMATRESPTESRMDQARAEARTLLEQYAEARVFLVLAASEPRMAAGRDARSLALELAEAEPEDTGAELEKAVALAEEKLRGTADARIVVLTDVNARFETGRPAVAVRRFGTPHDNLALLGARASRIADPPGVELVAVAVAHAATEQDVRVVLRAAATPQGERFPRDVAALDVRALRLQPERRTPVRFVVAERELQGAYELAIEGPGDAMDRDDRAVVLVPASPKLPVVVVGNAAGSSAVARALAADERIALQVVDPEQHTRIDVPPDALEIFLDRCPSLRRGRDAVVFGPPPGLCLDVDVAEPSATLRTLNGFRSDDPRTRFLSFDDVHAEAASTLRPRGGEGILAEDRHGALIVDASTPARMITLVGFSLTRSDLASKRSFVVFLRNLTELAERHRTRAGRSDLRAGEATSVAVPEDVTALHFDGKPAIAYAGEVSLPPQPRAGFGVLRWSEPRPGAQLVQVRFASPQESNLLGSLAAPSADPPRKLASAAFTRWLGLHPRTLLALCILLVLTLELVVFARRPAWLSS